MNLQAILNDHAAWLLGDGGECANLSGENLAGEDLEGVDLCWANLERANLKEANLAGADLTWVNLKGANLARANLSKANLQWANLEDADLQKADLTEADLSWASLKKASLYKANLTGTDLEGANLKRVRFYSLKDVWTREDCVMVPLALSIWGAIIFGICYVVYCIPGWHAQASEVSMHAYAQVNEWDSGRTHKYIQESLSDNIITHWEYEKIYRLHKSGWPIHLKDKK